MFFSDMGRNTGGKSVPGVLCGTTGMTAGAGVAAGGVGGVVAVRGAGWNPVCPVPFCAALNPRVRPVGVPIVCF